MQAKSIFTSKTFWANVLSIGAVVATASGHPAAAVLSDPVAQTQAIALVTGAVNIILRLVTKQPAVIK